MGFGNMRVLINDHSGHSFPIQLSRELASREYEVLHTYSKSFQTPKGPLHRRENDPENFQVRGIELSEPFQKYSYVKRRSQEKEFGHLLSKIINEFKPNLIISCNTPIDAQSVILNTSQSGKIKFIFWVQDIYSIAIQKILTQKLSKLGSLISLYYKFLERRQLQKTDAVVLITEDFIPLMKSWGIDSSKCWVIPNWAPINELPIFSKINDWSIKNELNDKICIMYSGTLGMKHNPEILLRIAQYYKNNEYIRVVVISEGLGAEYLKSKKIELNLNNLIIMNFQPFEDLPHVLSSADIFVAVLEPDAGIFSVPSKVLTYLCFKRPLILAVPEENLAARIVQQNNAGKVVNPKDIDGMITEIDKLVQDSSLRKKLGYNAYKYAKNNFDINLIADSFEKIIKKTKQVEK